MTNDTRSLSERECGTGHRFGVPRRRPAHETRLGNTWLTWFNRRKPTTKIDGEVTLREAIAILDDGVLLTRITDDHERPVAEAREAGNWKLAATFSFRPEGQLDFDHLANRHNA